MEFNINEYKRCIVVKAIGRIDSATAPELEKTLTELIDKKKTIVMDMSDMTFVSSAGWWAIIRAYKEMQKEGDGEIVLANLSENVRSSMDLIGILPYFPVYESLVEAVGNV